MLEANTRTASPAQFAATDMLHRRILLAHRFQLPLGESAVCIKTNSSLIGDALRELEKCFGSLATINVGEWEIAVEVQSEAAPLPAEAEEEDFETYCFGPSRSVRMNNGSWFAHTPPSTSGIGFAMVTGDECRQMRQLAAYFKTILRFLEDSGTQSNLPLEREVFA